MTNVLVLYYSTYGHIEAVANAGAEGARETGASVDVRRVTTKGSLSVRHIRSTGHYAAASNWWHAAISAASQPNTRVLTGSPWASSIGSKVARSGQTIRRTP